MVRRGSTVRVRQRALQKPRMRGFSFPIDLQITERGAGMEPFMEPSGPERRFRPRRGREETHSLHSVEADYILSATLSDGTRRERLAPLFLRLPRVPSARPDLLEHRIRLTRLDHERVVDDVPHAANNCELGHCSAAAAAPAPVVERVVGDREEGADAPRARVCKSSSRC